MLNSINFFKKTHFLSKVYQYTIAILHRFKYINLPLHTN